jgi:acyl transferase domain-containing protein
MRCARWRPEQPAMVGAKESVTNYIDYLETLSKKQLMVMLARQRQEESQGIAVIGMGCRFPGGLDTPEAFWTAIREGRVVPSETNGPPTDSLGRVRWNLDAPDVAPAAEWLRSGAYLSDIDRFDAEYFGLSDEEALYMDPQHRLLLEVAVQALADANITRAELRGRRVGIFIGVSVVEYGLAALRNGVSVSDMSPHMGTGYLLSAASGRLGLTLGVNGPALTIDTASSSALSAAHLASLALRRRECDLALVGACHLLLSPLSTVTLARAGMLSATGRCRPFADDANGHVRAEGCGILVLKRHQDALADGDSPYALIRGSAVHQQGERASLALASASGQKAVMEMALRNAGVDPLDVQYLEAQANGSRLGAVIESESVAEAYGRRSPAAAPLYLGSCKANIGYLETASGVAGLMKTVLALAHCEIPPQAEVDALDSRVPWDRLSLRVTRTSVPWPSEGRRLAGVNAFGITGTLAHVVLEGTSPKTPAIAAAAPGFHALLVLSAHNPEALALSARRLHHYLASQSGWDHAAVCRTLAEARDHQTFRRAALVSDRQTLLEALLAVADGESLPALAPENKSRRAGPFGPAGIAGSEKTRPTEGGLFLAVPALSDERLRAALGLARAPEFEALAGHIRAHAEQPQALAWALGWLDWLKALKLEIAGAAFGGNERFQLAEVIASPRSDWEITVSGETLTVRRRGASSSLEPTPLAQLDPARFIALLAARFCAGADLALSALSTTPRRGLCRLPGPVFTGRSYWLEQNLWT